MVGNMNRRITVNTLGITKDAGGGVSKSISNSFSLWAFVENKTGQANFNEGQRQADYDYKIKVRFYETKNISTANTLTYEGKNLKPVSVQKIDEGKSTYLIIKATIYGGN